jgi:TolB protein
MRHRRHIVAGAMRMLGLLSAASAVALILATAGGGSARRAPSPVTLAVVPNGVYAVAQDSGRVVWDGCRGPVVWKDSRTVQLGATKECGFWGTQWIAIAGTRVLWAEDWGGNNQEIHVFTASLGDPRRRRVGSEYGLADTGDGVQLGGIAGVGSTLAYTTVSIAELDDTIGDCLDEPVVCRWRYGRGQTTFLAANGRASKRVGGGFAIAASDGLVALAKYGGAATRSGAVVSLCGCSYTPDWSPDGKSIALTGDWASAGTSIFIQSVDRSVVRRVTSGNTLDANPRWSPDGSRLAFDRVSSTATSGAALGVYVVVPGGTPERLTSGYQPDWSPDGSRIAFVRSGIFTMDPSGGSVQRLVGGENGESPRWSPDGSQIAFVRDRHIYIVPATGGKARLYTTKAAGVIDFDWSPTGDRLVFGDDKYFKVRVIDVAKGVSKVLGPGMFPSWSQDGRLAYSEGYGSAIRIVDGDGNLLKRLIPPKPTAPDTSIEVRRARGGELVASFAPQGAVLSVGLSKRFVAAPVQDGNAYRLQIFSLPNGRLLRDVAISARVNRQDPPLVAVSGSRVVYSDGRAIHLLDVRTGKNALMAMAKVAPSSLSISGNRVVWAENREGKNELRGFVRTITIPSG